MYSYIIEGGKKLEGEVKISGSKNASLPIIAATILNGKKSKIYNVPNIHDMQITLKILKYIGCKVSKNNDKIEIDSRYIKKKEIPEHLMREMRSTVILAGAILSRFKEVTFSYPGGCDIGARPIDLHFPSVGATENIILASVLAEGKTVITNAAREPEIVDLVKMLNKMGAKITGEGTNVIEIEGVKKLQEVQYRVMPDRIEAGTFLCAGAITGGRVTIKNAMPEQLVPIMSKLEEAGCKITVDKDKVELKAPQRLKAVEIKTMPYPGFPTDMQSIFGSVLSVAKGTSVITENIFENRFKYLSELQRMGAKNKQEGNVAIITGVRKMSAASVKCTDLRGGVATVLAGLQAKGRTKVTNIEYILRGYENLDKKLNKLGANIQIEEGD